VYRFSIGRTVVGLDTDKCNITGTAVLLLLLLALWQIDSNSEMWLIKVADCGVVTSDKEETASSSHT
jgi:hypothetical protein